MFVPPNVAQQTRGEAQFPLARAFIAEQTGHPVEGFVTGGGRTAGIAGDLLGEADERVLLAYINGKRLEELSLAHAVDGKYQRLRLDDFKQPFKHGGGERQRRETAAGNALDLLQALGTDRKSV